jgi:hypothetical protein
MEIAMKNVRKIATILRNQEKDEGRVRNHIKKGRKIKIREYSSEESKT